MTQVLTNAEKIRRLPWNTALNATNTVFAQLIYFGPAWVLFLSELKLDNTAIGFLLSLIPFSGLVALVVAPSVARFGYKRTWVTFFGLRKIITAGLLLVPAVIGRFGPDAILIYITALTIGFSLCKAIADTAMFPWAQEFIPNTIRGRYASINDIVSRLVGIASIGLASYVLGLSLGLNRFMVLFAIALIFGFLSVWASTHIPGGAPARKTHAPKIHHRDMLRVLKDRNFLIYMAGLGVLTIGTTPMASFLPLFMEQQVGLADSHVVLLQIGTLAGGLASTYLAGWASDRYGSKPVMLSGLVLKILLPLGWMLMPRNSEWSLAVALGISVVNGIADIAWVIGSARLLYVQVVPTNKSAEYMAVYYAAAGLIGGISQIVGGRVLDFTQGLSGQFLIFTVDPFFPLFVFGLALTVISVILFRRVQADSPVSVGEFVSLFIHGNPVTALESMFRFYRARDERQTVVMTERLGRTNSPLTVDELLDALRDPRFNVRFEAIISIARMDSDPRLVEALCSILDGTELSLTVIAAWALGRMGDERALVSLRAGLDSPYRSIQSHCARSLGTLGDKSMGPKLLERLQTEEDKGLRIAFASALGTLEMPEAIDALLDVLATTTNEGACLEVALGLARIVGHEHHFVRLLRRMRGDKGTAVAQDVAALRRRLDKDDAALQKLLTECADDFAREDFDAGIARLVEVIRALPPEIHTPESQTILDACAARLEEFGAERTDYLILALHVLHAGMG